MNKLIIVAALLLLLNDAFAQKDVAEKVTATFTNATINEFIEAVESQTNYRFYLTESLDSNRISFDANNTPLILILDSLFQGPRVYYTIDSRKNIFLTREDLGLQRRSQAAKVFDENPPIVRDESASALLENKLYEIGARRTTLNSAEVALSGTINIQDTKEPVIGVAIRIEKVSKGTTTDHDGNYVLRIPPGRYVLTFTSVGLKPTRRNVLIHGDGRLDVEMQHDVTNLQEVVVKSETISTTASLQLGSQSLNIQTIKIVPTSFGEADVLKAILTLPGVKTVGEASSGFNVRGGAADQNLITLNGSTIYNPFHFFGFFSSFNPEAISNVELFKGSVPAAYGGRLSSILKVTGRDGNNQEFHGSAGIGLLTSRINLEGPIVKDRLSFLIGGRTTYSNWIFKLLPESSGYKSSKASFSDLNARIHFKQDDKNDFRIDAYYSSDESNLNTDTTFNYVNRNFSLEWEHEFTNTLRGAFTIANDHFNYGNYSNVDPVSAYQLKFSIGQTSLRGDFLYDLSEKNKVTFGVNAIHYELHPGSYQPYFDQSLITPREIQKEQGLETAFYVEDNFEVTPALSLAAGVRYSIFNYIGKRSVNEYAIGLPRTSENLIRSKEYSGVINSYQGFEPRLSARYLVNERLSFKAGYTVMRQYIHMLSNTVAISPTDIWKLSDPNIKPQFSQQVSIGVYKTFGLLESSLEGYGKRISNYLDYKSGAVLVMNDAVEQEVMTTEGKAYGIEVLMKKPSGKFNGWISYTYSRTFLKVDDPIGGETINRGEYYPASYDKPHDFNFTGNQKLSKRFNFSLNVNYSTGRPVTIPIGVFYYGGSPKTLFSDRNGYRIPDYFRADISVNLEGNHKVKQFFHNSWTFGVYNVTGRRNPYSVFYTKEGDVIKGYKLSVLGSAIPFVNFNIKF